MIKKKILKFRDEKQTFSKVSGPNQNNILPFVLSNIYYFCGFSNLFS